MPSLSSHQCITLVGLALLLPACAATGPSSSDDDGGASSGGTGSAGGWNGGAPGSGGFPAGPGAGGIDAGGVTGGSDAGGSFGAGGASGGALPGAGGASSGSGGNSGVGGTGGSGDPPGLPCEQSFSADGHDGCLTTLSGIDTKYYPLSEGTRAARLAVYLHGDSAWEWYQNGFLITGVLDWAKERDVVVAALLSPVSYDGDDPMDRAFGALNESSDIENIGGALDALVTGLGVSPSELMFWSTSGGSWFLTSSFFPVLGGRFQGDFALSCGASTFNFGYEWDPATETSKRNAFDIWFNYGSEDFLASGVDWSFAHYQGKGFSVSKTVYPGAEHCSHAIIEPTIDYFTARFN